jgi:hypothetical protein
MEETMNALRFAQREFVEATDLIGALLPVPNSEFASSDYAGMGAAYLEMFVDEQSHRSYPSFAGISDFEKVAMVAYRGMRAHMQDCELVRLVQVPLYVTEVKPFRPLDPMHMELREKFARMTGFILVGPDEVWAALYKGKGPDAYTFCTMVENNDLGTPRTVCGYYADGVEYWSKPVTVAELDATATKSLTSRYRGNYLYSLPQTDVYSELQYERMRETLKLLIDHESVAPPERSSHGSKVFRSFISNGDTESTRHMRPYSEGWRKYPTYQDAWYFGCWFNPQKLELLMYAEQDVIHTVCDDEQQFKAEMAALARSFGREPSPSIIAIGEEGTTFMYDCLTLFRREDGKCVTLNFSKDLPAKDEQGKLQMPLMADLLVTHPSLQGLEDGQSIALTKDQFQMNILDPMSWDHSWNATATRRGDQVEVSLLRADVDEPLVATAALISENDS